MFVPIYTRSTTHTHCPGLHTPFPVYLRTRLPGLFHYTHRTHWTFTLHHTLHTPARFPRLPTAHCLPSLHTYRYVVATIYGTTFCRSDHHHYTVACVTHTRVARLFGCCTIFAHVYLTVTFAPLHYPIPTTRFHRGHPAIHHTVPYHAPFTTTILPISWATGAFTVRHYTIFDLR